MPAPSSNNSQSLTKIEAKCKALHGKREEEDWALEAKIVAKQKQIEEERLAEEKRAAEEKKKEAVRKAKFDRRAQKWRQEVVTEVRRKEKQKGAEESDESEEESEEESEKEPGLSVPKKRRIQETVSKINKKRID